MRRSATGPATPGRPDPPGPFARAVRCARAALPVALPAALPLAAFVAAGAVEAGAAAAVWLAVLAAAAAGLWPVAAAVDSAAARVGRLAPGGGAAPFAGASRGLAAPLERALAGVERERRERANDAGADPEAVLDALPDPLLLLDERRVVSFANRRAESAFGAGLAGRPLAAALRAPPLIAAADRLFDGGPPARAAPARESAPFEVDSRGEGRRVWTGFLQPIAAAAGPRVALTLRDVTGRERDERLRADFVANASHEIRTPLTALVGAIETLRGPARDDPAARDEFLAMMSQNAERIGRLVENLLSLSRIERGEHAAPSDPVALGPAVARAVEALAWRADARGARIAVAVADDLPPVPGDADELERAFQNLIGNAIEHGGRGAVVRVEAAADGGEVAVAVIDDGPGVAAGHIPRLTERFYRVNRARSGAPGGAGLGLAIVKHIVLRHRGTLDIASVPGEGSRFTIRLKAAARRRSGFLR